MSSVNSQPTAINALRHHWPEYLIEGWALGMFMISAGVFTVLFEYPHSPLNAMIHNPDIRRMLIGVAMGLTAVGLIYSPWGQRSGAHMNPAVTLTFWWRRKISTWNAVFYVASQCIGGTLGVYIAIALLGQAFTSPQVNYVTTIPGSAGILVAFVAELVISGVLMFMVLRTSNSLFAKYTGVFAGILVALFISIEAPLSGMSINPARSLASAIPAHQWSSFWIYIAAPIVGMQLASLIDRATRAKSHAGCAKLIHSSSQRCIHCGYQPASTSAIQSSLSGAMS